MLCSNRICWCQAYVYRVVLWWLYVQTNAWEYRQETWGPVPVRRKNYLYVITCPADCQLLLTPAILDDSRLGTWLCLQLFVILSYLQASKLQVMAAPTLCNTTWQKCIAYTLNTWEQSLLLKPLFTLLWLRTFCFFLFTHASSASSPSPLSSFFSHSFTAWMLFRRLFVLRRRCCGSAATWRRHCSSRRSLRHRVQLRDR